MSSNWSRSLRRREQPRTEPERTGTRDQGPAPARRQTWTPSPWRRSPAGWTRRVRLLVGPVLGAPHLGGPLTLVPVSVPVSSEGKNSLMLPRLPLQLGSFVRLVAVERATSRGSPVGVLVPARSRPQVCSVPSGVSGNASDVRGSIKRLLWVLAALFCRARVASALLPSEKKRFGWNQVIFGLKSASLPTLEAGLEAPQL